MVNLVTKAQKYVFSINFPIFLKLNFKLAAIRESYFTFWRKIVKNNFFWILFRNFVPTINPFTNQIMKKLLSLSLIGLFPFVLLKLPNEEVSGRVLAPIFYALLTILCIIELYKRVKDKRQKVKIS